MTQYITKGAMNTDYDYLQDIKLIVENTGVYPVTHPVLEDVRFVKWSGSAKPNSHHYGDGGLLKHTYEVLVMAIATGRTMGLPEADLKKLVVAAIWHDYGKIWDYELGKEWGPTRHKKEVRHLIRSVIECEKFAAKTKEMSKEDVAWVTAVMLSHHGDFHGTTHPPLNAAAWILSCCDKISARATEALAGNNMF